jgi:formylglycine-generating enzyme required for sulfatase activity
MTFRTFTVSLLLAAPVLAGEPGMVFIPGGGFQRGRSHDLPDDGLKWYPTLMRDDRPVRTVFVDPFYLDEHEVTNAQYFEFVKAAKYRPPYNWPGGRLPEGQEQLPVVDVSWEDAAAYAGWAGKRLPTEAEWERACRGLVEGAKYPWGGAEPDRKQARYDVTNGPGPVCGFPRNYFGLCDMAGNVWEWVSDWYDRTYYERATERNPPGPETGLYRVLRGGSWADTAKYLTCANRSWARPGERSPNIGFRCAKKFRR